MPLICKKLIFILSEKSHDLICLTTRIGLNYWMVSLTVKN